MEASIYYHRAASRIALTTGKGLAGMQLQAQGPAGGQLDKPVPTFGLFYPARLPASRTQTGGGPERGAWPLSGAHSPHCQSAGRTQGQVGVGGTQGQVEGTGCQGDVGGLCSFSSLGLQAFQGLGDF